MADLKTSRQITAELEKQQKLLKDIDNNSIAYKSTQQEILRLQKQLSQAKQKEVKESIAAKPIYKQIEASIENRLKIVKKLSAQGSISSKIQKASEKAQGRLLLNIKSQVSSKLKLNDVSTKQLGVLNELSSGQIDIADLNQKIAESEERIGSARLSGSPLVKADEEALNNILKGEKNRARFQKLSGMAREKGLQVADNLSGGMASKAKEFGAKMGMSPKNLARLGVAGVVVGVLIKAVTGFSKKIDAVGDTFGFLTNSSKDFRNELISSGNEAMMIGKGLEDVISVTAGLNSEFGISLSAAQDIAGSVLDTAKATGLSNDEAQNLFGTFMQIGDLTAAQAENLIESTAQLAAQEGVAPNAVLKDMAASAEEIATFTQDGGQNIAEAAVQARKMGISLSTTAKIAEGLLDFESSIQNEIEASVLIGKQLNFQKARELALNNDIAGATKAVVDQLGSEEEFNNLNAIQRQSIAKSIGVSVAEMKKLVGQSDKLTLSGALAGKSFDDLVGQDALSGLSSIINSLKMIGAEIMDGIGKPIADMLKSFQESIMTPEGMLEFKKKIMGVVNFVLEVIKGIAGVLDFFGVAFGDDEGVQLSLQNMIDKNNAMLVNDIKTGPGGINYMSGPAGSFKLNPRDSVLATTNPIRVNDMMTGPAGSMGVNNKPQTINIVGNFKAKGDVMEAVLEGANNQPGYNSMQPRFG